MDKFTVGFIGTAELSYIFLESLLTDPRFKVPFIITKPDINKRRSSLLDYLDNQSLTVYTQNLTEIEPSIYNGLDCVLVVAYGEKIPGELLTKSRWLNVHGSILPNLRGASPIQYAIALGFQTTGLTLALMNERIDAGPIVSVIDHAVNPDDTFGSLSRRMGYSSVEWLKTSLIGFLGGTIIPTNQGPNVTRAPMIKREWTILDWNQPVEVIDRKVRALHPAPLAVSNLHGFDCKIVAGHTTNYPSTKPGSFLPGSHLIIETATNGFQITKLIPQGRKMMTGEEFLRGFRGKLN